MDTVVGNPRFSPRVVGSQGVGVIGRPLDGW